MDYGVMPQPGQKYVIAAAASPNMVMDSSGNPMERRKCILYERNYGENQKWVFVPGPNSSYFILNCQDRGTLEIPEQSQGQEGTQLHVAQPNNTVNEAWYIRPSGAGVSIHAASNQNLAMNVGQGLLIDEAWIIIWPFSGAENEIWRLIPTD